MFTAHLLHALSPRMKNAPPRLATRHTLFIQQLCMMRCLRLHSVLFSLCLMPKVPLTAEQYFELLLSPTMVNAVLAKSAGCPLRLCIENRQGSFVHELPEGGRSTLSYPYHAACKQAKVNQCLQCLQC